MSRIQLRPALRAYAHAPAAAPAAAFTNTLSTEFDGTDDLLYIYDAGGAGLIPAGNGTTVSFWFKWIGPYNGHIPAPVLFAQSANGAAIIHSNVRVWIDTGGSANTIKCFYYTHVSLSQTLTSATGAFDDDTTWVHVCVTNESGTTATGDMNLYIDGVATADSPVAVSTISYTDQDQMVIGGDNYTSSGANMAKVKVNNLTGWKRALTSSEVTDLYNSGAPSDPTEESWFVSADLHCWYQLGDGDSIGADSHGSNDLSVSGDPATISDVPS